MDINKIKLDNNFKLVEASAGTGKSFTLAHIVLRNVLEKKIKPDEILLLSFTRNTCSELRDKIFTRFKNLKLYLYNQSAVEIDNTLQEWNKNNNKEKSKEKIISEIDDFINQIYKLKVTTFHSFCNSLLEEYSVEIGSSQDPYIDNDINLLYQDVIDNLWIDQFLNLHHGIISAVRQKKISSKFGSKINKSFFVAILQTIDQENICNFQIKNKYMNIDISSYLKEYLLRSWHDFCIEWNKSGEELYFQLIYLGKLIKDCGGKSQIYPSKPRNDRFNEINNWINSINKKLDLDDLSQLFYDISKDDLLFKYFYSKNIIKEINKFDIDLDLDRFNLLQEKIYQIKEGIYTEFVRIFIQLAYIKLISLKKRFSIFNFNDLIKTIEKKYLVDDFNNDTSFEIIQNRFKCILVDEFQDTDITQWNIIKKFFNTDKHFLLCVGDPKQAIYRFRGGDIDTYLNARSSAFEVFTLKDNYRSSMELLAVINMLYKNGFKESKLKYRKLSSKINKSLSSLFNFKNVFEIVEFSYKENDIEDLVINYIVRFILDNKNVDINKISILTLNNSQCLDLKKKLFDLNIPCQIQNKENIFDTEASSLLLLLIDCLINPRIFKNISLLAASKFIEFDLEELVDNKISKKLKKLINQCINWSLELKSKGFLTVVNELILYYKSSSIINNADLYSDLFQISEIIEIELIDNDFNIFNVSRWYQNQLDPTYRICNGDDYLKKEYNPENGINLSTIHSSKGLEYEIVLCPYLSLISKKSKKIKGPVWKSISDRSIYINISNSCDEVKKFRLAEEIDLFKESERLIYVALTRSKYKLIIFNDVDNKNNILNNDLLPNLENIDTYKSSFENKITKKNRNEIFNRFKIDNSNNYLWKINKVNKKESKKINLDQIISYSSYSSWTSQEKKIALDIYQYRDYEDNTSIINNIKDYNSKRTKSFPKYYSYPNPLSDFPKGKIAGTCLHKIIEKFEFINNNPDELCDLILEELSFHQIDTNFVLNVRDAILRMINISLGSKLKNKRLVDIPNEMILKEVKYDLTFSYKGRYLNSYDISKCFLLDHEYEFSEEYASKVNELKIQNKGFHSGCIDCVIPIGNTIEDSKWWVIDWKSNFISDKYNNDCLPINYTYENMRQEMIKHHYPLQSHLYLLALHRLLKWRIKNYDPRLHLGGYIYIFLKGLPDFKLFKKSKFNDISPGIFIGEVPLNRINYLDNLF